MGEGVGDAVGVIDRVVGQIASGSVPMRHGDVVVEAERRLRLASPDRAGQLVGAVVDQVLGLGPIEGLLRDPEVTDVLVNGPQEVWVDRNGELSRADVHFESSESLLAAVERVIAPLGLRIDRSSPMVDARLPDGSRLHAVTPPASVEHPIVAIRRFTQAVDLAGCAGRAWEPQPSGRWRCSPMRFERGRRSSSRAEPVPGRQPCSTFSEVSFPRHERVVTIEDAAELRLPGHVVRLEAHPPNCRGRG